MLISLATFSQTGIKKPAIQQDSAVIIKADIARKMVQDLVRYDGLVKQYKELNGILFLRDRQIDLLQKKDSLSQIKIVNLENSLLNKDKIIDIREKNYKTLEVKVKKAKTQLNISKVVIFILLTTNTILITR